MPSCKYLKDKKVVAAYRKGFCNKIKYKIPLDYFLKGKCYGFFDKDKLVGGFCLVHDFPWRLRSIMQVPETILAIEDLPMRKTAEFTGYYLEDKKNGLYFTLHLIGAILRHPATAFVYSYPVTQTKLEEYYAKGNPKRIYSGIPLKLHGHHTDMEEEHVEVLTKWGIIKIFLARTFKYLFKKIKT